MAGLFQTATETPTLRITVQWDEAYWLASDDIWAFGTGRTIRAALRAYLANVEDFLDAAGDGSDLGGPALAQYRAYRAIVDQAWRAPKRRKGRR